MSQLPDTSQRKLFKYYIEQNQAALESESKFWYRNNRWRFNTKEKSSYFTYGYKTKEGGH